MLYLPGSASSPRVRVLPEQHELANVAWALCLLPSPAVPGQVTRQVHLDRAQALDRLLGAVMEQGQELHLPGTHAELPLVVQREAALEQRVGTPCL